LEGWRGREVMPIGDINIVQRIFIAKSWVVTGE
jgi:hypothetical protein